MDLVYRPAGFVRTASLIMKKILEQREKTLEQRCVYLCNLFGLIHVKGGNSVGVNDQIIAGDNGKTMWLEIKRRNGRISEAQLRNYDGLRKKGHIVKFVKTQKELDNALKEFLTITRSEFK